MAPPSIREEKEPKPKLFGPDIFQKNPRAHKNKSALPPPKTQNTPPPPLKRGILWTWVFPAEGAYFFQASIKLTHPFPAPELRTKILWTRGFFWFLVRIYYLRDFAWDIPEVPEKFEKKKSLCSILVPYSRLSAGATGPPRPDLSLHTPDLIRTQPPRLVAQCSATPATVAATPPCSATPFQTQISVRHLPAHGGGEVRHQNF